MSIMVAEVYKALVEVGASEESARAAASAIPLTRDLATKEDLWALKEELLAKIEQQGERIERIERGLGERIGRLERDMSILKLVYGPAILALLVKIAFFS